MKKLLIYDQNSSCFKKTEKVDIYNLTKRLFKQYYCYYKQMPMCNKLYCGTKLSDMINELLDMTCCMYFQKENFHITDFIYKLHVIDFKLREMYSTSILSKKHYNVISKIVADTIITCQNFKEKQNELC